MDESLAWERYQYFKEGRKYFICYIIVCTFPLHCIFNYILFSTLLSQIKPVVGLPLSVSKFTCLVGFESPRYPVGTFLVCSKTNTIAIIQMHEAASDEASEKSSIRSSSGDSILRYDVIHEIPLCLLMASYGSSYLEENKTRSVPIEDPQSPAWVAARDPSVKVYSLNIHPILSHIVVVATSVGVVVLSLFSSSRSMALRAQHVSWGMHSLCFVDKSLRRSNFAFESDTSPSSPGASRPVSMAANRTASMKRLGTKSLSKRSSINVSSVLASSAWDMIALDAMTSFKENILDSHKISADAPNAPQQLPQLGRQTSQNKSLPPNISNATFSSAPIFNVSPSGMFCSIHWPESLYYVIYRMKSSSMAANNAQNQPSLSDLNMREVDKGQCYSIAWVTGEVPVNPLGTSVDPTSLDGSNTLNEGIYEAEDMCVVIYPYKRIDSGKKKRFGGLFNEKEVKRGMYDGCLPSMMVIKRISKENNVTETINPGGPNDIEEVVSGGRLLCITYQLKSSGKADQKAVSQIEMEAILAQQNEEKSAGGNSSVIAKVDVPPLVKYRSQFYLVQVTVPTAITAIVVNTSTDGASGTEAAAAVKHATMKKPVMKLVPVGPLMPRVSALAWDAPYATEYGGDTARNWQVQLFSVLIDSKISILCLTTDITNNGYSSSSQTLLSTIAIVDPSPMSCLGCYQMNWWNGNLFVATFIDVFAIFCHNPYPGPKEKQIERAITEHASARKVGKNSGKSGNANIEAEKAVKSADIPGKI